ncbi:hypothetical protein GJAV_G00275690 [Gymnothorax javanicus]|nr:hypothetical protein GJAV_G00275690 [Gymnothorax javanicus]
MEDRQSLPVEDWEESDVSSWLKSIGVKVNYIEKMKDEEVDGKVLLELTQEFLEEKIGMKSGPAHMIIQNRDRLIESLQKLQKALKQKQMKQSGDCKQQQSEAKYDMDAGATQAPALDEEKSHQEQSVSEMAPKRDCYPRPMGKKGSEFTYLKNSILPPESGASDLITPCHEYKSFATAATLSRAKLQSKFANEVFKFASACMNIRSNGTIHFGVMDSQNNSGYSHGEVIGVPVKEKDMYVDALDHIEKSFKNNADHARHCIRGPEFIKVGNYTEEHYVIEVDVIPEVSIVRGKVYSVCLPNFNEESNKIVFEKGKKTFRRNGANTETVCDLHDFYECVKDRDAKREKAEESSLLSMPDFSQDLGRKLKMLVAGGKKVIDKDQWYILVTNKFENEHLSYIDFLLNLKIFCVFDFDSASKLSGFCSKYLDHHAANLRFLEDYRTFGGMKQSEFENHLQSSKQPSWIFCNGRSDYRGDEKPCDEMTWIKTKKTLLKEAVSVICKQILPPGTFLVIFLITSPVELPMIHTFHEFYSEMQGHEDIICISEYGEYHRSWTELAQLSCSPETISKNSVVGLKMSHVNSTIQSIQSHKVNFRQLPTKSNALCQLKTIEEEKMSSLDILCADQCDKFSDVEDKKEMGDVEKQFYRGGKVSWLNFWLAEKKFVGEFIQRDVFKEISKVLNDTPRWSKDQIPINSINIYHQPGSGGSTIARHVLWNNRQNLRCAVAKPLFPVTTVAEHAVKLREYDEKDHQKCLPVLLLLEDHEEDYVDELRNELEVAMKAKKINQGTLCFVLLSCRQVHVPKKFCKKSPLQNFPVTHKLSLDETRQFARKRTELEEQHPPEHLLTFVLMSEGFEYVSKFVTDSLKGIDLSSVSTRLIRYVALLNTYVQDSYLSQSHCEALLHLHLQVNKAQGTQNEFKDQFRRHLFESSLSEPAKLFFIHLRNEKTNIKFIRIIHPLVAEEILNQLLGSCGQQSSTAIELLREKVLFEHRFGKDDYRTFLRDLCMRRCKISRGDEKDTFFSPLIEHVQKHEGFEKAVEVLEEAYSCFNDDTFFAQQLARLHYRQENFKDAERWIKEADKKKPKNSFILDTKGQVYKSWFNAKRKELESDASPETAVDAIATALEAMQCFAACEAAANSERDTMNNSGFFSEVDLAFNILHFIHLVFQKSGDGDDECLKYLLTDYIPEAVKNPWINFHSQLKSIHQNMLAAFDRISEDLTYFQTGATSECESNSAEIKINNPIKWLAKKSASYGKFFGRVPSQSLDQDLLMRMKIYGLSGGNMTTIFSLLSDKKQEALEQIIDIYSGNGQNWDQKQIVTYLASQISLSCLCPTSSKLASLQALQKLSQQFQKGKSRYSPSVLFLQTLLFWPEEHDNKHNRDAKYEIIMASVDGLRKSYSSKIKDIPQKQMRIFTHFFLGNGRALGKLVHKSKMEMLDSLQSVSARRMKWFSGDVFQMQEVKALLKRVQGWTKDGKAYIEGPQKKPIMIQTLKSDSIPGNENVEFYLGFTFQGPVAYDIVVSKAN